MDDTCATCRFFKQNFCYRYPPQVYLDSYYEYDIERPTFRVASAWPEVGEIDSCGEHRAKASES